jgi:AraC-like DNA-binding protein
MQHSLTAASFNLILQLAGQHGLDREALCRQLEVAPQLLTDPDARIPTRKVQELWKLAVEGTGQYLPLRLGESVNLYAMGMLAYLLMHCPTLGEVFVKLCHYQDIACEGVRTRLEKAGERCCLKLEVIDPGITYPPYALDSEMAVYSRMINSLAGKAFPPEAVHLAYSPAAPVAEYRRAFGTELIVGDSDFTGLVFGEELLNIPVLNANPALFPLFEEHADEYLRKLKRGNSLAYRVRQQILVGLKGEEPNLNTVARQLAMSERNVQLKLKEEGTTYRQLLDEVRRELAVSHLREPYLSTSDIAYLLGFSEPAVFSRTFKKWTGTTPLAFRQAKQA